MLSDLYLEREQVLAQLDALQIFPNTRTVRQLRRELKEKLQKIEEKIERLERPEEKEEEQEPEGHDDTNLRRAKAMEKHHRFIRLIYDIVHPDHPKYSYNDIRKMFALRKRGRKVDIPDVIWQNPSP